MIDEEKLSILLKALIKDRNVSKETRHSASDLLLSMEKPEPAHEDHHA